jgi:predicted NBD/HSP70 family sugar kinase
VERETVVPVLRKGSPALVRDINRAAILSLIGREGPISRAELARRLHLSPATVTTLARGLIRSGLIGIVDRAPSSGGRRAVRLGLVSGAAHALGVKIAPDHVVGVRVDLEAGVLERFEQPFDQDAPDAVEQIVELLRPQVATQSTSVLLGIGLGVPGVVTAAGVVDSPLLGWRGVPIAGRLQEELAVPVLVDNDVNTLAIAERLYGSGREVDDFLTVTIGRGVGLGIVLRGDVYRGSSGGAGEFGHVPVAEDGPRCSCGNRGCLEAVVGDPALAARGVERHVLREGEDVERLRTLADEGNADARAIYDEAGAALGRAVASLVNVFDPKLVLVSGEGTQAWPHLAPGFRRALDASVFAPLGGVAVEVDPWDDAKWARGAAALVLRATFVAELYERQPDYAVRARLAVASGGAGEG